MAAVQGKPAVDSRYYSGQGICMMAERDAVTGQPLGFHTIGNVPELTIGIEETTEDHKESHSGQRGVDLTLVTEVVVNVTMTFESFDPVNLALGLKASITEAAAGTAVAASIGLYPGKWTPLAHLKISSLALEAAGTNPNLGDLVDTDLTVDEAGGMVMLAADYTGTYVAGESLNFTYSHAAQTRVEGMVVSQNAERYMIFRGLNTIGGKQVRLAIPRLRVAPFTDLGKINDGVAQVQITCTALADSMITTPGLSQYFSEIYEK